MSYSDAITSSVPSTAAPPTGPLDLVWTSSLSARDAEAYDAFVERARGGHYAQTRAWADVATADRPLRARYFLARGAGRLVGAALVLRPTLKGVPLPVAIVERGPVCDDPSDVARVTASLAWAAHRRGVARVQVMPYWSGEDATRIEQALAGVGFRVVQELDGAHARTLRMDIAGKSDDVLLAGGDYKSLRQQLRLADKAGATVRRGAPEDVLHLERLHAELMRGQGKGAKSRTYFERLASSVLAGSGRGALFLCTHDAEIISAVLVVRHGALATFVMGASCASPRKFAKMALPLMEAVRWARTEGCATFDLGGVPMAGDDDEKRARIAAFKFDFSKTHVDLVREHARWF